MAGGKATPSMRSYDVVGAGEDAFSNFLSKYIQDSAQFPIYNKECMFRWDLIDLIG